MLISDKMAAAINTQIGNEFGACLQYVSIAAHFGTENLPELSKHFHKQAMEEKDHALVDATELICEQAAWCWECEMAPSALCGVHEEALAHAEDYDRLAGLLRGQR